MNRSHLFATATLAGLLAFSRGAMGETWYVKASVSSSGNGASWGEAFQAIQGGIDEASDGDTVLVAEGTYVENVHFDGKNIILCSTDPLDPGVVERTVIDGNQAGSVITFAGTETYGVLEGFTICNGEAEFGGGICGGPYAVERAKLTIRHNTITGNTAELAGGGIDWCEGLIYGNTITGNMADHGGGLADCRGSICGNTISQNRAKFSGGGLLCCHGSIKDNLIVRNHGPMDGGGGLCACQGVIEGNLGMGNLGGPSWGGGLDSCQGTIRNNNILFNSVGYEGGGISMCEGIIEGNVIAGNSSGEFGGGIALSKGTIRNNLIAGNFANRSGGGLYACEGTISNDTIVSNHAESPEIAEGWGGGIADTQYPLINCIVWGNSAFEDPQLHDCAAPRFSCIESWTGGGEGNIAGDPHFVGSPLAEGNWTSSVSYNKQTFQTTLVDSSASWQNDALTGLLVNPNTDRWELWLITANTGTTLTVWGEAMGYATAGHRYEIYDYRLDPASPCVDEGDTAMDVGRFDVDGGYRRIGTVGKPGWSDRVDYVESDAAGGLTLRWKGAVDIGAYECQVLGSTPETFCVQVRESMDSGGWIEVFSGNVCFWTDNDTSTLRKFYRIGLK